MSDGTNSARRIVFHAQAGDAGNPIRHESDPEDIEATDEELEEMAQEFMWEMVRPEYRWKEIPVEEGQMERDWVESAGDAPEPEEEP